jgi:hypothetical protein
MNRPTIVNDSESGHEKVSPQAVNVRPNCDYNVSPVCYSIEGMDNLTL